MPPRHPIASCDDTSVGEHLFSQPAWCAESLSEDFDGSQDRLGSALQKDCCPFAAIGRAGSAGVKASSTRLMRPDILTAAKRSPQLPQTEDRPIGPRRSLFKRRRALEVVRGQNSALRRFCMGRQASTPRTHMFEPFARACHADGQWERIGRVAFAGTSRSKRSQWLKRGRRAIPNLGENPCSQRVA